MVNKLKWNNHKSTFFEILKAQRETSKYTDATLAVDGKFYPVHKLVLSTCSEYFSEIFERTACKSPVIVLKDVQSHDIEALLDYIYVGEVDVKQDHLASLLKTANCLRIKGLGVPEEYQTKSHKNSISSHDVAHARPYSPPPKRRKHDSNAALANPNQSPHIPSNTSSNTKQEDESLFVKVEIDDSMEEEVRFIKEDVYEAGVETDHNPGKVSGYDITKKEQEPESYVCTSLPGPSSQQFTSSTSNTKQDEFLVVKVGLEAAKEPDLRVSQKHNYDGATSSDLDPLGGDDGSIIFNTEHNQEYYGSTSLPGSYLQQSQNIIQPLDRCDTSEWKQSVLEPIRIQPGHHFPVEIGKNSKNNDLYRECWFCNKQTVKPTKQQHMKRKQRTTIMCKFCHVALCTTPCFDLYHTVEDYVNHQKHQNQFENVNPLVKEENAESDSEENEGR